jgi:hypothetical protein
MSIHDKLAVVELSLHPRSRMVRLASSATACPGEVESGSPTRTRVNSGIYGVSRSYGIIE